jgi:hypothetical protein
MSDVVLAGIVVAATMGFAAAMISLSIERLREAIIAQGDMMRSRPLG